MSLVYGNVLSVEPCCPAWSLARSWEGQYLWQHHVTQAGPFPWMPGCTLGSPIAPCASLITPLHGCSVSLGFSVGAQCSGGAACLRSVLLCYSLITTYMMRCERGPRLWLCLGVKEAESQCMTEGGHLWQRSRIKLLGSYSDPAQELGYISIYLCPHIQ